MSAEGAGELRPPSATPLFNAALPGR